MSLSEVICNLDRVSLVMLAMVGFSKDEVATYQVNGKYVKLIMKDGSLKNVHLVGKGR